MKPIIIVALLATACSKGNHQQPVADKKPAVAPADAGAAAVAPTPKKAQAPKKVPPPSPAALADYHKHLKAGRALAKRKQWKKAAAELDAALKAIPNDGRALSELGWVAFEAGDYDRARTVNAASVKYAAESKVKAASLYNLGRVAEAEGKKDEAAKQYQASLRLRPGNKAVAKRLAQLGASTPEAGDFDGEVDSDCDQPMARDKLCDCKKSFFEQDQSEDGPEQWMDCNVTDAPLPEFAYVNVSTTVGMGDYSETDLAMKMPDGNWRLAAMLTTGSDGHHRMDTWSVDKLEKRKVGARDILWIEVSSDVSDMLFDTDEDYEESGSYVILCTLPDVTCGYRFPVAGTYSTDAVDDDYQPVGKPKETSFKASLSLAADGTATLRLDSGVRDTVEGFLGTHKLW